MQDFFFLLKSTQNYFSLSAAVALLIVYKVENQYSIWQMRALWSRCQDSAVLSITQLCLWSEGSACLREGGPNLPPDLQLLFHRPTVLTPLTLCGSVSPPPSLSLSLSLCLYHPDVPVPLLQVHQHGPESSQNARDDAALSPAHVTLPTMPGHAQQQDPPSVPPHTPPQCGSWLCG